MNHDQFKKQHHFYWARGAEMGVQTLSQFQPLSPLVAAELSQKRRSANRYVGQRIDMPPPIGLHHGGDRKKTRSLPREYSTAHDQPVEGNTSLESRRLQPPQLERCRREATINYRRMSSINQTLLNLDNRAMEETHKKIFDVLERVPETVKGSSIDQSESDRDELINIEKLKKVIRQLEREDTWLHTFTNIIPVLQCGTRSVERLSFLKELDKIHVAKIGFMSRDEFKLYNASVANAALVSEDDKKLLDYCKVIADAKKVYCFQTRLFVPTISLLLVTVFLFDVLELMKADNHLRFNV